jgi:hypothetical protein
MLSRLGSAAVLSLVLSLFVLSVPANAHRGHVHRELGHRELGHDRVQAELTLAAATAASGTDFAVEAVGTRRTSALEPDGVIEVAVAPAVDRPALHQAALHQPASHEPALHEAADNLQAAPLHLPRATCYCGSGCGTCTSASCCTAAVLPTAFVWQSSVEAAERPRAASLGAPGLFGDPLPRPPNPVRYA